MKSKTRDSTQSLNRQYYKYEQLTDQKSGTINTVSFKSGLAVLHTATSTTSGITHSCNLDRMLHAFKFNTDNTKDSQH